MKIHNHDELATVLPTLPGAELLVIEFLDTRGADGKFRKYRVMMIDGKIYPLHAAVSGDWKVHYFSADMAENAEHRAEDEAFLSDMAGTLGTRAMRSLNELCTTLGLDYAGADFGLNNHGDIVLFEANATMFVDVPGNAQQWGYRRVPAQHIMDAVRAMLTSRAQKNLVATQLVMPSIALSKPNTSLPSTAQLLTTGGDRRIVCDSVTGTNKYNCPPIPEPYILAYGSATASTISPAAFAAAEALRQRLQISAGSEAPSITYARELQRTRKELQQLFALDNTDILFASSGTDLHLLAAQLACEATLPLILMMESTETAAAYLRRWEGNISVI